MNDNGRLPQQSDWPAILLGWIRRGKIGCTFATKLSRTPDEALWESCLLNGIGDAVALEIDRLISDAYDRKVEALTLMLAGITTSDQIAVLINELCSSTRWFCEEIVPQADFETTFLNCEVCNGKLDRHCEMCRHIHIGLRYVLPNEQVVWVLGLAPLAESAPTRQIPGAPFSVLFLRPSPAPDSSEPGKTVHLCHMRSESLGVMPNEPYKEAWDKMMDQSSRLRQKMLQDSAHCSGKAKVTFTLPASYRPYLPLNRVFSREEDL